jgi:distribution and morphology protein 10
MGNLTSTYAVKAGPNLALCSRFDFNFYSYESELVLGCELWRRRNTADIDWAVKKLRSDWGQPVRSPDDNVPGVLKARVDQDWRVGVLWEGRIKELLFTLGASLDLKKREHIFRSVGLELQYSS